MIDFYEIDEKYLDFLRNFDSRVPRSDYTTHDKFFCGVVLVIGNNIPYYAPVSHFNTPQQTNIPIYDKGSKKVLSTVRFFFMIPVMPQVITRVDVKTLYNTDPSYAILVDKEYSYCSTHEALLNKRAEAVYKIGCNKNHVFNKLCCDFKKLEGVFRTYNVS